MSVLDPSVLPLLPFYRSRPQPCPYLPGLTEQKLFTKVPDDPALAHIVNSALTQNGFRRSYDVVYRPLCPSCSACTPVRVPVAEFAPGRTQRRILRKNERLGFTQRPAAATPELFALFQNYETHRHADSDMAKMNFLGFRAMLEDSAVPKSLYIAHEKDMKDAPIAAVLTDRLADGLSAVYSFFSPAEEADSLGTWLVLKLIETVLVSGQSYLYLGYWIAQSRKMAYKSNFRPLEALGPGGWQRLPPPD